MRKAAKASIACKIYFQNVTAEHAFREDLCLVVDLIERGEKKKSDDSPFPIFQIGSLGISPLFSSKSQAKFRHERYLREFGCMIRRRLRGYIIWRTLAD